MKLAYIRPERGKKPTEELMALFSDDPSNILDIKIPERTEGTRVEYVEDALKEKKLDLYKHDTFLLCSRDLLTVGESVGRNALNYGIVVNDPAEATVSFGRTQVLLRNAVELPHKGEPRVLVINIHPDNEPGLFAATGHAYLNHHVHLLAVTGRDNDEWKEEMVDIYDNHLNLGGNYTFLGIPDKSLSYNEKSKRDFEEGLCQALDEFKPDVVIQTSPGRNEDHTAAFYLSREILERDENSGVGFILGDAIESGAWMEGSKIRKFSPNLWQAIHGKGVEELMGIYDKLKTPQYKEQVSNILRRKEPAASSKFYSYLINNMDESLDVLDAIKDMESEGKKIFEKMVFGCYGMQVIRLSYDPGSKSMGYCTPHMTEILKRRELTK